MTASSDRLRESSRLRPGETTLSELDLNYLDATRVFVAYSDTGEYAERRSVAISSCGLPVRELNWGFLKPPYEDLPTLIDAVRSYFDERKLPFHVAFRDDAPGVAAALAAAGWKPQEETVPAMALPLTAAMPAPLTGLAIEEVHTPEALVAFREAAFLGFGHPVRAAHLFINERMLELPQTRFYVGRAGGAVVATSMLVATGGVGGIYWVATLEGQRGRGYGAALTWAAIAGARALGCEIASLQASRMGRPVYARMGFEQVVGYARYVPGDRSADV